jgi:flagellar motor switch/type III secretory pathway protein FliN
VAAVRDVRRWASGHLRIDRLGLALGELVGAEIDVRIGRAQPLAGLRAMNDGVGVFLARADAADVASAALVEAEGALAANLIARALKRPAPRLLNPGAAVSPGVAGAFGAVVLAAARRAHAGIALRVLAAGPAPALESDFARLDPELWAVSLTVLVAHDAFESRVIVSRGAGLSSVAPPWNARALAALGATPLALPVVACATFVAAADLATLRPGDAFVPLPGGRWPLARGDHGRAVGPVLLAPSLSEVGLRAKLGEDGRIVLRGGLEPLVATEAHMESDGNDAVVAALGEVPVVVRVEIGEAVMPAREWASLGRGDVVALGRRVGEPVLLRVGGVPLARGELVELEGEVAVRIVERLIGAGTSEGTP